VPGHSLAAAEGLEWIGCIGAHGQKMRFAAEEYAGRAAEWWKPVSPNRVNDGRGWPLTRRAATGETTTSRCLAFTEASRMSSRRKRKRDRQHAEATAVAPRTCGGWGQGVPTSLKDLVWLRRAIKEGWPVRQEIRDAIVDELVGDLRLDLSDEEAGDFGRDAISRVRCIVAMEGVNQEIDLDEAAAEGRLRGRRRPARMPGLRDGPHASKQRWGV
jgi:hypothetical protein